MPSTPASSSDRAPVLRTWQALLFTVAGAATLVSAHGLFLTRGLAASLGALLVGVLLIAPWLGIWHVRHPDADASTPRSLRHTAYLRATGLIALWAIMVYGQVDLFTATSVIPFAVLGLGTQVSLFLKHRYHIQDAHQAGLR